MLLVGDAGRKWVLSVSCLFIYLFIYLVLSFVIEITAHNANCVDPDLHCLPMSFVWDAKHEWMKDFIYIILWFS